MHLQSCRWLDLALQFHRLFDVMVIWLMEEDEIKHLLLEAIYLEPLCLVERCFWAQPISNGLMGQGSDADLGQQAVSAELQDD